MSRITSFFLILAIALPLSSQQPGADPGHPNAVLLVNGIAPPPGSNDVDLNALPVLTFHVDAPMSPTTEDIVLILGTFAPGGVPTPWGGSLDFSSGSVIADGFGYSTGTLLDEFAHTPFNLSLGAPPAPSFGNLGTVQAIVTDPTNTPPFRNTIAIRVTNGVHESVYTMGDDDWVTHTLAMASPIRFGASTYTQLNVCSNGFVTFGVGDSDFTETMAEFFGGWGSAPNPGVAVAWTDLNPGSFAGPSTYAVLESPFGVTVEFRDQEHWSLIEPAGTFSVTFEDNGYSDTRIDLTGFIPGTASNTDILVGVTDGDPLVGIDTDLTDGLGTGLFNAISTYSSPSGAPDSIGEHIPAGVVPAFGTVLFFENGVPGTFEWSIYP